MKSYIHILMEESASTGIPLLKAFKFAGIPTSTYYRTIKAETELRFDTAEKVMKAFAKLQSLQESRRHIRKLRNDGEPVDRREIRSRFKPRSSGA